MSPLGRKLRLFGLMAVALFVALAAVTAVRLRLEGRSQAAHDPGPKPVTPTRHADFAGDLANLRVTALSDDALAQRGIARRGLGDLDLPTGAIVATDPLVQPERTALARTVAPGSYAVTLYRAQERVALAELRFASGTPARWQIAIIPGQDAGALKVDEIFGYPVDAGLGCFMDVEGQAAFAELEKREKERLRKSDINLYDDVIAEPLRKNGDTELLFKPLPDKDANIAIFQSGWGDGFFASYWGLDEAGKPLVLVTDFGVLEHGDGFTPQQRWTQAEVAAMTLDERRASAAGYAALEADDLAELEALLKQGRISPQTAIEKTNVPFTYMAIAMDKAGALDLFVRYGADRLVPSGLGTEWKTYADFARSYSRTKPDGTPEYHWLKPRSPELMAVIRRWGAAPPNP